MALIAIKHVRAMLEECAPGYRMELKTHNWFVYYNKITYPSLPKYDEIAEFVVRKLARSFKITECAKKFFNW